MNAISFSSPALKKIGVQYRRLYATRVQSDYKYDTEMGRSEAEMALQAASWIVSTLHNLPDRDFKAAPLVPR